MYINANGLQCKVVLIYMANHDEISFNYATLQQQLFVIAACSIHRRERQAVRRLNMTDSLKLKDRN